jgi:hypothetical protein
MPPWIVVIDVMFLQERALKYSMARQSFELFHLCTILVVKYERKQICQAAY